MYEADPDIVQLGTCMVKTHLSLSHDPDMKGRPRHWKLPIRDILIYKGAGFVVPVAGAIKLMPGTASNPAYRGIDVDVDTGKVKGVAGSVKSSCTCLRICDGRPAEKTGMSQLSVVTS